MLKKILFSLPFCLLLTACFDDATQKQSAQAPAQRPPVPVDVMQAKSADNNMSFEYPARLESVADVQLVAKTSGALIKQNFTPGQFVKQGDTLFVLDSDKHRATLDASNAAVAQAQANFKSAKSEMERITKLANQKAVSQKEFEAAVAKFEAANGALLSANASAKLAKLELNYTEIKAPFDGIMGENLVDVGSFVSATQTKLARISDISKISARFYIADSANIQRVLNLKNKSWEWGNKNAILMLGDSEFKGEVKFIDSVVDANSGSVLAKAEFDNKNGELLPGAFAKIAVDGFVQKNSFLLPQIAVKQDAVGAYVLIAKDGKVAKKMVKIVYQTSTEAIISQGLEDGDMVILNNFGKIGVGAAVTPSAQGSK